MHDLWARGIDPASCTLDQGIEAVGCTLAKDISSNYLEIASASFLSCDKLEWEAL